MYLQIPTKVLIYLYTHIVNISLIFSLLKANIYICLMEEEQACVCFVNRTCWLCLFVCITTTTAFTQACLTVTVPGIRYNTSMHYHFLQ